MEGCYILLRSLPILDERPGDVVFQVAVETLIGVMFRTVRRQKDILDLLLVVLQPSRNDLSMMESQVTKNEEYLLIDALYQAGHELNKEGGNYRRHGQSHPEFHLDCLVSSYSGPQGEWQLQLLRGLADEHSSRCFFLSRCQSPFISMTTTSNSWPNRIHFAFEIFLPDHAAMVGGNSDHFSNRSIVQSILAKADNLLAQFALGRMIVCTGIFLFLARNHRMINPIKA